MMLGAVHRRMYAKVSIPYSEFTPRCSGQGSIRGSWSRSIIWGAEGIETVVELEQ